MNYRLSWLDVTRGIAVLLVLAAHTLDKVWPSYEIFIQLGNAGVVLFFLCSGYVIPMSIEHANLQRFWKRRFFRLYPLYWLSIFLSLALGLSKTRDPIDVLVNMTMLQSYVDVPHILDIYWSLTIEIMFYIFMSLLRILRIEKLTVPLFLAMAGAVIVMTSFNPSVSPIPFYISICLFGTLFYRYDQQLISQGQLFTLILVIAGYFLLMPEWWNWKAAWVVALMLFTGLHQWQGHNWPRWLIWCGLVSYSLYLFHPIPLTFLGAIGILAAFPIAAFGYYFIERPSIALGRRLTAT